MARDNTAASLHSTAGKIPDVLKRVYKENALITVGCEFLGGGRAIVEFVFPDYKRTADPMTHVSAAQICLALLEGTYCALEDGLHSGAFPPSVTPEWFYSTAPSWVVADWNTLFRETVVAGKVVSLTFSLLDVGIQRYRHRRLAATVEYTGFVSGETRWIIDPPPGLVESKLKR